jgi:hypothetical protein
LTPQPQGRDTNAKALRNLAVAAFTLITRQQRAFTQISRIGARHHPPPQSTINAKQPKQIRQTFGKFALAACRVGDSRNPG